MPCPELIALTEGRFDHSPAKFALEYPGISIAAEGSSELPCLKSAQLRRLSVAKRLSFMVLRAHASGPVNDETQGSRGRRGGGEKRTHGVAFII